MEPVAQINNTKAPDLSLVPLVMQNKRIFFGRVFSQKKKKNEVLFKMFCYFFFFFFLIWHKYQYGT